MDTMPFCELKLINSVLYSRLSHLEDLFVVKIANELGKSICSYHKHFDKLSIKVHVIDLKIVQKNDSTGYSHKFIGSIISFM